MEHITNLSQLGGRHAPLPLSGRFFLVQIAFFFPQKGLVRCAQEHMAVL